MTIGSLAASCRVKISTVRFYERAGLMPAPTRTAGRQRTYTKSQQLRLLFICRARELKFSIEEIRLLLALAEPPKKSCGEVRILAVAHLKKLRQKITDLTNVESVLSDAVRHCSARSSASCPILDLLENV